MERLARPSLRITAEARVVRSALLVFRIGEERDVARLGGLNPHDPADLDVPSPSSRHSSRSASSAGFHLPKRYVVLLYKQRRLPLQTRRMSS